MRFRVKIIRLSPMQILCHGWLRWRAPRRKGCMAGAQAAGGAGGSPL